MEHQRELLQTNRTALIVLGAGGIASLLFFHLQVLGRAVIPYDYEGWHVPIWQFLYDSIGELRFPHYDPYSYAGVPFLKNVQAMTFYLPVMAYLALLNILHIDFSIYAAQFVNVFHYAVAYAGFYLWLRSRNSERILAHALALTGAFCGSWIANAQHAGLIAALAWVPHLLWTVDQLVDRPRPVIVAVMAGLLVLVLTSGFLPVALTIYLVWAIYSMLRLLERWGGRRGAGSEFWRDTLFRGSLLAGAFALHLLIAAPFWLPVVQNSAGEMAVSFHSGTRVEGFLTFFAPDVLKNFEPDQYVLKDLENFTVTYHFAGYLPFLALGLAVRPRTAIRNVPLVTFFVILALSRGLFGITDVIQRLPVIGLLHRPEMYDLLLTPFLVGALGGLSVQEFRRLAPVATAVMAGLALELGQYVYVFERFNISLPWLIGGVAVGGLLMLAVAVLPRDGHRLAVIIALAVVPFCFHATVANAMWMSKTTPDSFTRTTVERGFSDLLERLRQGQGPHRVAFDQEQLSSDCLWHVWRIETINGSDPTLDASYYKYLTGGLARWSTNRSFGEFDPSSERFDDLNVRYYLTTPNGKPEEFAANPNWQLVYDNFFKVFERKRFVPRFRLETSCSGGDRVEVIESRPGEQVLSVATSCEMSVLRVSERPHRGWHVYVDGAPVRWAAANPAIGMRILVKRGKSRVELRYLTPYLSWSFMLSGLGVAMLGTLALRSRPGSRETQRERSLEPDAPSAQMAVRRET